MSLFDKDPPLALQISQRAESSSSKEKLGMPLDRYRKFLLSVFQSANEYFRESEQLLKFQTQILKLANDLFSSLDSNLNQPSPPVVEVGIKSPKLIKLQEQLKKTRNRRKKRNLQKEIEREKQRNERNSRWLFQKEREQVKVQLVREFITRHQNEITSLVFNFYVLIAMLARAEFHDCEEESCGLLKQILSKLIDTFSGEINLGAFLGLVMRHSSDYLLVNNANEIMVFLDKLHYLDKISSNQLYKKISQSWHSRKGDNKESGVVFLGDFLNYNKLAYRALVAEFKHPQSDFKSSFSFIQPKFANFNESYADLTQLIVEGWLQVLKEEEPDASSLQVVAFYHSQTQADAQQLFHIYYKPELFYDSPEQIRSINDNGMSAVTLVHEYLKSTQVRHLTSLTRELDAIFHILSTTELRNLKLSEDHLNYAKSGNIIIDLAGRKHTFGLRGLEGQLRQLGLNSIHFSHRERENYYSVSLEFLDGKIEFGLGLSDLELVGLGEASQPLRQWLEAIAIFYLGEAKHSNIDLIREKDKAEVMPQDNKEVGEMGRSPHLVILPLGKGPDHRGQWFATDWNETLIEQWGFDLLTLNALFILAQIKLVQGGGNEETTIIDSMLLQVVEESLEELKNSFSKEINTKSLMNITIKLLRRSFARSFARRFPVDYEEHSPSLFQLFNQVMTGNFNHVALRKHDEQVAHGLKKFSKKWNFYMVTLNHGNSKRPVPFTVDSERLASFTSPPAIKTS